MAPQSAYDDTTQQLGPLPTQEIGNTSHLNSRAEPILSKSPNADP
jgi:hypothetical protein